MSTYESYESPLCTRYASRAMQGLFSARTKFTMWRRLWVVLAEQEQKLGLPITDEQIAELKAHVEDIDFAQAEAEEKITRHDVMAHIRTYGAQCPKAKGIIHLGATSCYVGDNADILIMARAMRLVRRGVLSAIAALAEFADLYKDMPTLGFTHFQSAQLTTVGKRATLWISELMLDLGQIDHALSCVRLLGSKGTTGTQASFRELFDGDYSKARALDEGIAKALGFAGVYPVSGQTYSRKVDDQFMSVLSGIAQTAHKFSNDMRLLQHLKEVEEPFESEQVGSSAMAYKRNPMRSERMAGLCRYVIANSQNTAMTAAEQWFERTLDDSANRRIALPEAFLAVDSILRIFRNVASGLVVYPRVIEKHVQEELPFMATENILMEAVLRGGDRQDLHERIRRHSMEAGKQVKVHGKANDLLDRLAADPALGLDAGAIKTLLNPADYIGFAPEQTRDYLLEWVRPLLQANRADLMAMEDLQI